MSEGWSDNLRGVSRGKVGKREGVKVARVSEWLPWGETCCVMISSRVLTTKTVGILIDKF